MRISNHYYRAAAILIAATVLATYNECASADDLFIGKFASETRENFGPGILGKIEVSIVRREDTHILSVFHEGEFQFDVAAIPCSPDKEDYLKDHPPGDVSALCNTSYGSSVFVYSQNGIKVPTIGTYYKTQYYGHIQWSFWGFRKVQ